jgi:hypothetical protein
MTVFNVLFVFINIHVTVNFLEQTKTQIDTDCFFQNTKCKLFIKGFIYQSS